VNAAMLRDDILKNLDDISATDPLAAAAAKEIRELVSDSQCQLIAGCEQISLINKLTQLEVLRPFTGEKHDKVFDEVWGILLEEAADCARAFVASKSGGKE
jgi:hypothetical protein